MFTCNFRPYEGNDKFIFISYAHKDSAMVYPIIEQINADGYRVWFDDGISPGSEWPEYIAHHIAECEVLIFFASPNSADSENCRREINFALSRKKKFFTVTLVPTTLSPGIEMQLSSQQNIAFYDYSDKATFFKTLYDAPSIAPCKVITESGAPKEANPWDKIPCADNLAEVTASSSIAEPVVENSTYSEPTVAAQTYTEPASNPSEYSEPVSFDSKIYDETASKEKPNKSASQKKSKKGLIVGLIAAAIGVVCLFVVTLVLVILISVSNQKIKFSSGDTAEKNSDSIFLSDSVTSSDIKKLNKMKKLKYISFEDASVESNSTLNNYKHWDRISYLSIDTSEITDYSFLEDATSLTTLIIQNEPMFADLEVIKSSQLHTLVLDSTGITSINLSPDVNALYTLNIKHCDLSQNTNTLPVSASAVTLSDCNLTDVNFLAESNFKNIHSLDLSDNQISDISFLSTYYEDIDELLLSNNPIDTSSLSIIMNCTQLKTLSLDGIHMDDLSITANMNKLTKLSLADCGLTSLANGPSKLSLTSLVLKHNDLTSVSGLDDLLDANCELLDLSCNNISQLNGIPSVEYEMLLLYGNPLKLDEKDNIDVLSSATFSSLVIDYGAGIENVNFKQDCDLYLITDNPKNGDVFDGNDMVIVYSNFNLIQIEDNIETYSYASYMWK